MARKYEGRKALVTGAASGIGKHLVEVLIGHGARVVCCDLNAAAGQAVVDELNARYGSANGNAPVAWFVKLNVTSVVGGDGGGVQEGGRTCEREVGLGLRSKVFDVNTVGAMYTIQGAINHFRSYKSGGSIIVTASLSGLYAFKADPAYSASKHAVIGLVRSASLSTYKEGIFINAIAPASTESGMMTKEVMDFSRAVGMVTSKESIMEAFEHFLKPGSRASGQVVGALHDKIQVFGQPSPPGLKAKSRM
ncbi:hypothetical protein EIP91_003077 [Steccherinum ochraceum]|uniref:Uncharacterized protein n=1 Tax=Steccherinum ochraceum TaxID=92696 RepID=A0A4R0REF1_9APHY|nr:hypothetical protein EIP91_003077 [Steccherinum ochraceum]